MATDTIDPADAAWEAYRQAAEDCDAAAKRGASTGEAEDRMEVAQERLLALPAATARRALRLLELVSHVEAYDRDIRNGLGLVAPRGVSAAIRCLKAELGLA